MRWVARWLDKRGLAAVADVFDTRVAGVGDVDAMHALALRALSRGEADVAIAQLEAATAARPADAGLWCSLGAAYRYGARLDDARRANLRALALRPDYLQALSNLGECCIVEKRHEEALEWFDRALVRNPGFFEARLNKIAALFELARFDDAREAAEKLIADEPGRPEGYLNLGNVLVHTGKAKQGMVQYKKALELRPDYAEARFNLATLLGSRDELANVIGYLKRQIKERGESMQGLGMLAAAHQAAGHLTEAEELCRRILEDQPDSIMAMVTLGSCLSSSGDSAAALPLYEKVVQLDGQQAGMFSNILFELNNQSRFGREEVFQRHLDWAQHFEAPLQSAVGDFAGRDRDPGRKLRIGYVSGDFVQHPVGFLLRDILRHHDAAQFEIHCFSMAVNESDVMPDLRQAADHWEDIFFLSDEEVAALIRKAEIDILVDLSGHTALHRLLTFARRPAPVQFEWIGYFHSTGMTSIDYFITDPYTTPPGGGQLFSETPIYLPHTRFCYGPPEYAPEPGEPPCGKTGIVTFGSFNRLPKMNDAVVSAWARILKAVPGSRLVVKANAFSEDAVKDRLTARFAAQGVGKERLDLREASSHRQMFAEYGDIDIALDTFPFNGGMTTLEALWMGVPVVTLCGDTVVSRQTVSALANIGLAEELAFPSVDAFVAGAVALANNPARLTELRSQIRPRMAASPLRQSAAFTRDIEAIFRRAWQAYCRGERLPSDADMKARGGSAEDAKARDAERRMPA
ncbi:MAG: tetratricopeptide repeat protein [Rhodocyclaceae bacterium]|nr:tetratricopeptide repeat protein [Rhodocyclaceae bacterium]